MIKQAGKAGISAKKQIPNRQVVNCSKAIKIKEDLADQRLKEEPHSITLVSDGWKDGRGAPYSTTCCLPPAALPQQQVM